MRTTLVNAICLIVFFSFLSSCTFEDELREPIPKVTAIPETPGVIQHANGELTELIRSHELYNVLLHATMSVVQEAEQIRLLTMSFADLQNFYESLSGSSDDWFIISQFTGFNSRVALDAQIDIVTSNVVLIRRDFPAYPNEVFEATLSDILSEDIVRNETEYPGDIAQATPCFDEFQVAREAAYDRLMLGTSILGLGGKNSLATALGVLAYDIWMAGIRFCECIYETYGERLCFN